MLSRSYSHEIKYYLNVDVVLTYLVSCSIFDLSCDVPRQPLPLEIAEASRGRVELAVLVVGVRPAEEAHRLPRPRRHLRGGGLAQLPIKHR